MFAGLLSHLSAASTTLTRDRTTLAQQQRMQQQLPGQHTTQLTDALSRCQQVEAALHKKRVEQKRRWMHCLYQQSEQWKADWLWTTTDDGSEQQPPIAWRVRQMTQVWQVVKEEEAKPRAERRRKARMEQGQEDEEAVETRRRREGWSDQDESELQRLVQLDRDSRQDSIPILAPDGDEATSRPARPHQQHDRHHADMYRPPGRQQQQPSNSQRDRPSSGWQHSDIGRRHSGEWAQQASEQKTDTGGDRRNGGSKRRRDRTSDDDDRAADGRRSRAAHRRPSVDEFGRDVHDDDSAAEGGEMLEETTAREKAEKLKDEETERLLNVE